MFPGQLGQARLNMQIDLGFSDTITPGPVDLSYPTLFDQPPPKLRAYNRETAIAEKFEAMIKPGEMNSRMKDFFDIWTLLHNQSFDGALLHSAIQQTFTRRDTIPSISAACFEDTFGSSPNKQLQWRAFVRRSQLKDKAPEKFIDVWRDVMAFLRPLIENAERCKEWPQGGPWKK